MNKFTRRILFFLFFFSGFCGLVYQVVWTRLAFASFGIIMPVLSVVLSVFMLGLSVGSWAGGRWILALVKKTGIPAVFFYAGAELFIGLGAFAVPKLLAVGEWLLLSSGQTDSFRYLFLSALVLALSLLPWCVCMGTTFPFMMAYVRERDSQNRGSFSYLYLANVLGAMGGTFTTAVIWIEALGFQRTLWLAAAGNFTIAVIASGLGREQLRAGALPASTGIPVALATSPRPAVLPGWMIKWILFSTGFIAMAMEVVWTRAFTPVLKTQVYSFALIVFTYLGATFLGSLWYRHHLRKKSTRAVAPLMALLVVATFLPGVVCNPGIVRMDWLSEVHIVSAMVVLASIVPFCALLGYLTPGLIDEYAGGHPGPAGEAYAINVLGCILGPLFAGYILLPWVSERAALMILSLPFWGFYFFGWKSLPLWQRLVSGLGAGSLAAYSLLFPNDFQTVVARYSRTIELRRDYAAAVISADPFGDKVLLVNGTDPFGDKVLLVNGTGMTSLLPVTKFMVHLPLAFHKEPPRSALIVCFGMGTSYRSALSWDIDTTTVELVPGVVQAFGFYHADAARVLRHPRGHIVVDDGRRFLRRTREKFDVIVVDPPPPVETAGSSLLYSTEFYDLAKQHLNRHGIVQAWFPGGEWLTTQAVLRSCYNSFPYVRCFHSIAGGGMHMLASLDPIEVPPPEQLLARMPASAQNDLLEWADTRDLPEYVGRVFVREIPVGQILNPNPEIQITDDNPLNEYFLLRQMRLYKY